ncbi:N6-adenine-specific methylase [Plasmodium brasilianum]|uniref:N6-adenine-specific methylase n=1 Tax=Plasmodium brasilianum TaxID=5824 RepID=A0ACB9Y582_PLABR|nr:N6-adenine-specific methylase [Plasmodium brasilianum]
MVFLKYIGTLIFLLISVFVLFPNINTKICCANYIRNNKYTIISKFYPQEKNINTVKYIKYVLFVNKPFFCFSKNGRSNIKNWNPLNKLQNVVTVEIENSFFLGAFSNNAIGGKKSIKGNSEIEKNFESDGMTAERLGGDGMTAERLEGYGMTAERLDSDDIPALAFEGESGGKICRDRNEKQNYDETEKSKNKMEVPNKREKRIMKKDLYGIPEEELSIRRLPNRKIKSKYKFCKIKKYRETININYRKKKILSIHEGKFKNKKIFSPDTYTRPMMSKVKESIFSILSHMSLFSCTDINVIDIFSGSGNLGIECISRGIQNITFVDLSLNSCRTIYENLKLCNIHHLDNKIIRSDAIELLNNPFKFNIEEKFHLAFFTPPYEQIVYSKLIHSISESELFDNDCLIFIEYPKEIEMLPHKVYNLIGLRNRKFGRTYFALYVLNSTGKFETYERKDEFYPLHYNRKQRRQEKYI